MKSALPKVLHRRRRAAADRARASRRRRPSRPPSTVVVVGHQARAAARRAFGAGRASRFAVQEPQLGTGHALLQAEPHLAGASGTVVLLSGDVPLLRAGHAAAARRARTTTRRGGDGADGASSPSPDGYGRIVRDGAGRIAAIVEHKDASPDAAARSARSTAASTRSTSSRCSPRCARSARPTRRASTTCRIWCGFTASAGSRSRRSRSTTPREILGVNSRKELARGGGDSEDDAGTTR